MDLYDYIKNISSPDYTLKEEAQKHLDNLTKPKDSLGRLEEFARQIVCIQGRLKPEIEKKVIFTLAGDHGVTEEGVSAYPKEVTAQMVYNFLRGGAGVNVLSRFAGASVIVVDMGVDAVFEENEDLLIKKVGRGTKNFVKEPAMTKEQAEKSIINGIEVFETVFYKKGFDICGVGDMGIGNTTPSTAVISVITKIEPSEITGRGTGINDNVLNKKIEVIKKGIALHKPDSSSAIDVLSKVGGFEIGGIAGIVLASAKHRIPCVVDGLIATAGTLLGYNLNPEVKDYIFASHRSTEIAQSEALEFMGLEPVLDLNLRLGEGTGSCLAMMMIEAGVRIYNEMATFEQASVSKSAGSI
ncbi:MAG: nicotinate-nucleotide--dimethylbenzimidazole phosphoribosyltransferase [Candidatus Hydrogenedentota bacterium]